MKPSTRENLLKLLLPAALAFVLYSLLVNLGNQRELKRIQARLAAAEQRGVTPLDVLEQKAQAAVLQREVDQLKPEKEQLEGQVAALSAQLGGAQRRVEAIEALTGILRRNGLTLVEESPAAGGNTSLPTSLERVRSRLAERNAAHNAELWRLRFTGRYLDVLRALSELAGSESVALPVSLEMAQAELGHDQRTWVLLVLI